MSFLHCQNWRFEGYSAQTDGRPEGVEKAITVQPSNYETHFIGRVHFNFLCENSPIGPAIVSYYEENGLYRIIIRTNKGQSYYTATKLQVAQKQNFFSWLFFLDPTVNDLVSLFEEQLASSEFFLMKYIESPSLNSAPSSPASSPSLNHLSITPSPSSPCTSSVSPPSASSLSSTSSPNLSKKFGGSSTRIGKLEGELLQLDRPNFDKKYKFGLVYCSPNQTGESEMLGNVHASREFQEFLEFIGRPVQLQGFPHFDGGLDVKNNLTGTSSVYTIWREAEVMWHVNTLLPFLSADKQHLERKKHIGNDRVVVVFRDSSAINSPFSPDIFRSKQNHIIALVEPTQTNQDNAFILQDPTQTSNVGSTTTTTTPTNSPSQNQIESQEQNTTTTSEQPQETKYYRFSVATKDTVPAYGPILHPPSIYSKDQSFLDLFFEKLTSGVDATSWSTEFKLLMDLYYRKQFGEIVKKYSKPKP
eukprot:TRINITY_DN4994_c0_g1_i1.p1 TRINITY_DN4994_c0_g1~~TRINITY_DN4994_c0_g1_i1.p1  ORF type:complete len:474 (-),score=110.11 TRINITY_DN4994_c0_g1_i1:4-1425(-)